LIRTSTQPKAMTIRAKVKARGGCWFRCGNQQLHIGIDAKFRPAQKAHPAFALFDLEALRTKLIAHGLKVTDDHNLPGTRRFYADDPWGNRVEFVERKA
jgi:hypothetical protein